MKTETRKFDAANYIGSPEMQAEYLRAALEDGDPDTIAIVIGDIARARGASEFAKDTGLSRETIYKAFRSGGNPTLETLAKAIRALGFRHTIEPAPRTTE
jgi:probable addiction module antidote protein